MKQYLYLIITLLASCQSAEKRIINYIDLHSDQNLLKNNMIDLRIVLGIDYDTMFVFNNPVVEEINKSILKVNPRKKIRFDYLFADEDTYIIALKKGGKLVYNDILQKQYFYGGIELNNVTDKDVLFDGEVIAFSYAIFVNPYFIFESTHDNYSLTMLPLQNN